MSLSPGDLLGPYEILALIGSGGMGDVWKAHDTRLNRVVAIKRLKSESNGRFQQEARAIAALNHPHICQIYDAGPDYLVMEFIEGQHLRGPLPSGEALRIAMQIADALKAAHDKNILHCDLKPANLLIARAGVKLLDFGLARMSLQPNDDETAEAVDNVILGTAGYMSPEQALGKPLDERSDVFGFGAVLYELLSGRRAFSGDSTVEVLSSVVRDSPPPIESRAASLVARCLAKEPSQRYQSMAEVKAALEQVIAGKPANTQPSIAVLPFSNMSRDPDDEYFSDGLAEEILNILAHIPGLKVTARTSSFAFRGKEQDIRSIAEALKVGAILEGSVRRAGSRIRVTAQLINASDGYHLWSERYDREMTDVFAVQDEIAEAIATELRVNLTGPLAGSQRPRNLAAWEAFQEGQHYWLQFSPTSMDKALACYQKSLAADPNYALAHQGIAEYYTSISILTFANPAEALPKAREAARRALELDPQLGSAHASKAQIDLFLDHDWAGSERSFRRAIALSPEPGTFTRMPYALWHLVSNGRWREADAEFDLVLQLDPLYFPARFGRAFSLDCQGRTHDAEAVFRRALEIEPTNGLMLRQLAICVARLGRVEEAFVLIGKEEQLHGRSPVTLMLLGMIHAMAGQKVEAHGILQQLLETQHQYIAAERVMAIYSLLGELDLAFEWAEKSLRRHDPPLLWIKYNFLFEAMRSDPRYGNLLRELKLS